jgi:hypothetical protein
MRLASFLRSLLHFGLAIGPTMGLTLALTGCGVPGTPLPPSLGLPKPVGDLKAVRKGANVNLTWTAPKETTDGELIRKPGKMIIYRDSLTSAPAQARAEMALEPTLKADRPEKMLAQDALEAFLQPPRSIDFLVYTVVAQNSLGKSAGPSNQATIALVSTMAPPEDVRTSLSGQGVTISFATGAAPQTETRMATQYLYRIMRREEGTTQSVAAGQVRPANAAAMFFDSDIEWEKHYEYWVTPVTLWDNQTRRGEVEGDDSPIVKVFAHDTFPPATPSGLQAVFSGVGQKPFIDLTWTPNTEPDLAGYNVYRHGEGQPPVKVNGDLLRTPSSRDLDVQAGSKYFYSVSAVDLRGNESAKSEEASEVVPK